MQHICKDAHNKLVYKKTSQGSFNDIAFLFLNRNITKLKMS